MTEQQGPTGTQHPTAGPAAGTPAIVHVVASTTADGNVDFSHSWHWEDGSPGGGNGSIEIPKRAKDQEGTPIHFHLKDETNPKRGLDFTDDILGAMWVLRDSCPEDSSTDPEIPPGQMDRSANLLKVFNKNSEECTLHYRLRFKDKDGKPESYDPDIRNGGTNLTISIG